MAVAFRNDADVTNGTAGTSVTVAKPAGTTDGDQLIAYISAAGAPTMTPPAGWTLVTSVASGSNVTLWCYRKLAASEGASWTWTLGSSLRNWGWVGAYTGVDPTSPVFAETGAGESDTTLDTSTTLITGASSKPASMLVSAAAAVRTASGAATTWTVTEVYGNATINERADLSTNAGAGTDIAGAVGDLSWMGSYNKLMFPKSVASQTQTAGVGYALVLRPYFTPYGGGLLTGLVVDAALGADPDGDQADWTWTDITSLVHQPAGIEIKAGRPTATSTADPSQITFTLLNLNGEFTKPSGTYTADFVRNLPIRVRLTGFGVGNTDGYHRGTAFLASAKPRWDASLNFSVVDVDCRGRLWRLQRDVATKPVHSAGYRRMIGLGWNAIAPVAYWPFEDDSGATAAAPAVDGVANAAVAGVTFGASSTLYAGSDALATFTATSAVSAPVPSYAASDHWAVVWAESLPSEPGASTVLAFVTTTGTARRWRVSVTPGTSALALDVYDASGASVLSTSVAIGVEADFYGDPVIFSLTATKNGSGIDYDLGYTYNSGGTVTGSSATGTIASQTAGNVTLFQTVYDSGVNGATFGHLGVYSDPAFTVIDAFEVADVVMNANAGEHPGSRIQRLCLEEGLGLDVDFDDNLDLTMGPQPIASIVDLFRECELVEDCVMHDAGSLAGETGLLMFPARDDRDNASVALTLDMAAGQVIGAFDPALDDQDIVNDVEMSRDGGSSARVTDDNSIAVEGRYSRQYTVNTEDDSFLRHMASWRVNEGTAGHQVGVMRFPGVAWNLRGSPELAEAWLACVIGSKLRVTNPPSQYRPDDIDCFIEGYIEVLSTDRWAVRANLSPAAPYGVFTLANAASDAGEWVGRLAGDDDAAIRAAITSSATSIDFDPNFCRWTEYEGLVLPGSSGNHASTPDNAAIDITGDIDIRVDATLNGTQWFTTSGLALLTKYDSSVNQRAYRFYLENGLLRFAWSTNGIAVNANSPDAAHVPGPTGRLAVRVTMDVDDGGGNRVIRFYTAPTLSGTWTQLGSTITTAGTTSIFNSSATMYVGADGAGGSGSLLTGTVHAAEVRDGIGGTAVANPDFMGQTPGTTSFADSAGRTWTVNGTAEIGGDFPMDVRLGGEVVTASGITTTPATYVAAGAMSSADNAAVTPALYAGGAANDLILVLARIRSTSAGTLATPTGYTRLPISNFGSTSTMQLYAKVHSGSESNPTVTPSGGSAGDTVSAVTFGFRNMPVTLTDLADIVIDSWGLINSSAQNIAYPGLYPRLQPGCVVLALGGKDDDWTSVAALTGFTEAVDSSTTTGNDQGLVVDYVIQTNPAVVNEGSFTVTGGASAVSHGALVALAGGYQTMTVTRSTNEVVKAHTAGTEIEVDHPFVLGL